MTKREIRGYKVVYEEEICLLEKSINKHMCLGWNTVGGIAFNDKYCYQAMILIKCEIIN